MTPSFFAPGTTRVKICGITNGDDAAAVVAAGAGAIGINCFRGSKRFVEIEEASPWLSRVGIPRVAVVVNPDSVLAASISTSGCFDWIQFHGDESPEACVHLAGNLPWIRAVRVSGVDALADALAYQTPWLLLDAHSLSGYGGTGEGVDLAIAAAFTSENPERKIVLAGGLRPEVVGPATAAVRPCGLDVASGVECDGNPRRKDPKKVEAFIGAARSAGLG